MAYAPHPTPAPSDNVFIGDLPPHITQGEIQNMFAAYGMIRQVRVNPAQPGRKASALVRFSSVQEAAMVVQNLNGNIVEGLFEPVVARFANNPGGGGSNAGGGGWNGGGAGGAGQTPRSDDASPGDNVFVGDLPEQISKQEVEAIFSQYGTVRQARVNPAQPGRKASALVRFSSVEEATWVVQSLNGNLAEGLTEPIVVRFANKGGGGGGGGWNGGASGQYNAAPSSGVPRSAPSNSPSDNVFIGDLPDQLRKEEVQAIFSAYGTVVQVKMNPPRPGGKASALVRFASVEEATSVVTNLNGNIIDGLLEPIQARFANNWSNSNGGSGGWNRSEPYSTGGKGGTDATTAAVLALLGAAGKGGKGNGKAGFASDGDTFHALYGSIRKSGVLGQGHVPAECQVYIKNLPRDTTDLDLYRLFSPFGGIAYTGVKAMLHEDGSCKGFGFCDYADPAAAQAAIEALNGSPLPSGALIQVSTKVSKAKGDSKGA